MGWVCEGKWSVNTDFTELLTLKTGTSGEYILMARDQRTTLGSSVAHRHLTSLVKCSCRLILRTFGETECSIVNSDHALW